MTRMRAIKVVVMSGLLGAFGLSGCGPVDRCHDGVLNGDESDIDCGGTCGACGNGGHCLADSDCLSTYCAANDACSSLPTTVPSSIGADTYSVDNGVGVIVNPGVQAGYGIATNTGSNFRVVWTGDAAASGSYHEFSGTIWTAGHFSNVNPGCGGVCPLESGDVILAPLQVAGGERIDFDTFATDGLDGLDFQVTSEPVFFELDIDGQPYPNLVFFSSDGQDSTAASMPFGLLTQ